MANGGTGGMGYRGMNNRVQGYGAYRQWGTRGYGVQGVWATWAMGYRGYGIWAMRPTGGYGDTGGMGYKGYGPCGQWDTGVWATWAMGPMGDLLPKYQKDVKLSKRCQVVKKMSNVKK